MTDCIEFETWDDEPARVRIRRTDIELCRWRKAKRADAEFELYVAGVPTYPDEGKLVMDVFTRSGVVFRLAGKEAARFLKVWKVE